MGTLVVDGHSYRERSLDQVIDDLGWGWAQRVFALVGGGIGFFSGSSKQLVGIVAVAVALDLQFSDVQRGWLASIVFCGNLVGNLMGSLADTCGRRTMVLLGTGVCLLGWILSTWAATFWAQAVCRGMMGLGFGFAGPPFFTLLNEITPTQDRLFLSSTAGMIGFCLGMLFAILLVHAQDPDMGPDMDWRALTAYTAAPGLLVFCVACFTLFESPRFYAAADRRPEAVATLEYMRRMNSRLDQPVADWTFREAAKEDLGFSFLCHRTLRITTATLCLSTFVLNYSYYGGIYALPQVLPSLEFGGVPPTVHMAIAALVEIAGYIVACGIGNRWTRKHLMAVYLVSMGALTGVFAVVLPHLPRAGDTLRDHHPPLLLTAALSIYGARLAIAIGWTVVYLYAVEVYPTAVRATGTSFAIAFGRLGSILAPLAFEIADDVFWWSLVVVCAANIGAVSMLPIATKDRSLGDIAEEVCPIKAP